MHAFVRNTSWAHVEDEVNVLSVHLSCARSSCTRTSDDLSYVIFQFPEASVCTFKRRHKSELKIRALVLCASCSHECPLILLMLKTRHQAR